MKVYELISLMSQAKAGKEVTAVMCLSPTELIQHGCSVHGCALIKAAIKELNGTVKANDKEQSDG